MKVRALYHHKIIDENTDSQRTVHAVDHDGGGFVVSSQEVGIAIQSFLNAATSTDIAIFHSYLLHAFMSVWAEETDNTEV